MNELTELFTTGGLTGLLALTLASAKEKREAGAYLVQVWTGFIYQGPAIVKNICKGL
jgi:dihydroorotate dehydrogenase